MIRQLVLNSLEKSLSSPLHFLRKLVCLESEHVVAVELEMLHGELARFNRVLELALNVIKLEENTIGCT